MDLRKLFLLLIAAITGGYLMWVAIWLMSLVTHFSVPFISWWALFPISIGIAIAILQWTIEEL